MGSVVKLVRRNEVELRYKGKRKRLEHQEQVLESLVDSKESFKEAKYDRAKRPGGGYFLVKDYWGCAAGWGRIFTTRLTIMGLHF